MIKSFVEHKIIAIFATSKSAGGSPRRSINTLKGLYVACTFVVQAITFLNTKGPTTTTRVDQPQPNKWTNHNQTSGPNTATSGPSHGNNWPLPHPLPRREGRDYRDTPNVLLLVVYSVNWSHVNRCSAHFITLFYMH